MRDDIYNNDNLETYRIKVVFLFQASLLVSHALSFIQDRLLQACVLGLQLHRRMLLFSPITSIIRTSYLSELGSEARFGFAVGNGCLTTCELFDVIGALYPAVLVCELYASVNTNDVLMTVTIK